MKPFHGSFLLVVALASAGWLAALAVPYRVDTDTAFQLKSVQQWLRAESTTPATLRLPDAADLSHDTLLWSNWWPPGFPLVYTPLATLLSLAAALRLTSLVLFLVGSAGWLFLAERLAPSRWVRILFAASLAAYSVMLGGAATLRTADLLTYAAGPWLMVLALRAGEREAPASRLFLAGLTLGGSYWLRYSLFLAAVPLLAWIALRTLRSSRPSRIGRLALLALGFALPVSGLLLINLREAPTLSEGVSGTRSAWVIGDVQSTRSPRLAAALAGAPGLALFQNDLWITHLAYFSDARLPFLRGLGSADRLLLKSMLGIPGTLALSWGLWRQRRRRSDPLPTLALFAMAIFFLELMAVSLAVGYNYLANEPRLAVGLMPAVSLAALAGWAPGAPNGERPSWLARAVNVLLVGAFVGLSFAFAGASFARNEVGDRLALRYQPSSTGLFQPEISPRNVPEVKAAVAAVLRSPEDVLVLAGSPGWGSSFVMWLEFPQRALPAGTYVAPLGQRYTGALDLHGPGRLPTSRPLRVVLVVAKSLIQDGWLPRLQSRFAQARSWQTAPTPADSAVVIYFSDLGRN